ncbi:blaNDM1 [Klebsiella pneumoniae]|nr:blaNDM1 [Klebsiella pneumoniae]
MELPNIMHPVAKLSTALAAALMLSGCMPGEIRPTIGQQMETGDQRFGDLVFRQLAPNVWQHTSYLDCPDPQLEQAGDQPAGRAGGGDSRASGQDGRYGRAACGGDCDLCQCVVEPACPARGDGCGATQPDFRRQWLGRTSNRAQLWPAQGILPRPRPHQ